MKHDDEVTPKGANQRYLMEKGLFIVEEREIGYGLTQNEIEAIFRAGYHRFTEGEAANRRYIDSSSSKETLVYIFNQEV